MTSVHAARTSVVHRTTPTDWSPCEPPVIEGPQRNAESAYLCATRFTLDNQRAPASLDELVAAG